MYCSPSGAQINLLCEAYYHALFEVENFKIKLKACFYVILQENPGMEEYKAVTTIISTQTELLQVGDQEQLVHLTGRLS